MSLGEPAEAPCPPCRECPELLGQSVSEKEAVRTSAYVLGLVGSMVPSSLMGYLCVCRSNTFHFPKFFFLCFLIPGCYVSGRVQKLLLLYVTFLRHYSSKSQLLLPRERHGNAFSCPKSGPIALEQRVSYRGHVKLWVHLSEQSSVLLSLRFGCVKKSIPDGGWES